MNRVAGERSQDLVIFEGVATGRRIGGRIGAASRKLGQFTGELIVVDFPTMMREVRTEPKTVRELVNGRKIKTHSAGSLIAKAIVECKAEPLQIDFFNEVVESPIPKLVVGGLERVGRHIVQSTPSNPRPLPNARMVVDTLWQGTRHGLSNFTHVPEVSKYTAADYIEPLTDLDILCRRYVGALDEFRDFRNARPVAGAPIAVGGGCHDDLLTNPYGTLLDLDQQLALHE